jgi:serine/threonine protein kinase
VPLLGSGAQRSLQVSRFRLEAQVLAYLAGGLGPDPDIPRLYDVGEGQGQPYYVREYVEGHTLVRRVADRSLGLREGLSALAAVARTVSRIHDQEFVHQNLRPSNVLIPVEGAPKLIGFGRAGRPARPVLVRAGKDGAPADVDVQALIEMVTWLCTGLEQPIPRGLESIYDIGPAVGAAAFAEVLSAHLDEERPGA